MLIALNSPAPQMGKSTVADYLVSLGFRRLKFAAPLKDMVRVLLRHAGVDEVEIERYVDGDLKEALIPELGVTSRHLQITLGTEWGREMVRPDLWVHVVETTVRHLLENGQSVVIDDMRFRNELDMVARLGGTPVRVCRPTDAPTPTHRSELELASAAMLPIDNRGTFEELHRQVDALVGALG